MNIALLLSYQKRSLNKIPIRPTVAESGAGIQTGVIRLCLEIWTCDLQKWGVHFTTVLHVNDLYLLSEYTGSSYVYHINITNFIIMQMLRVSSIQNSTTCLLLRGGKKNILTVNKIPFVIIIGKQTTFVRVINWNYRVFPQHQLIKLRNTME